MTNEQLVTVIRPRTGWAGTDLLELWQYREVGFHLVWRDLKVRYKQTAFGVAWAVIQPLALMLVLSAFLGGATGLRPSDVPYPMFVLGGLVPWTLFAQSLNGAGNSVVANAGMLSKVYFPRLLFPLAAVGAFVVDFVIGLVVLAAFALSFGFVPTPAWLLLLPLGLVAVLVSLAIGVWIAALNVRYRDVRHALPFLTQLWFFATPIAYGSAAVPESLRGLLILNPMSGVVEAFRWVIIGTGDRPVALLLASVGISLVVLASGIVYFKRAERTFADVA